MSLLPNSEPSSEALLLRTLEAEKSRRLTEDRLRYYKPYPKQIDFHAAGTRHRERLLMAGNQLGKTLAGGFEAAMHATGRYPEWWQGKRFDGPTIGWACGVTGEVVRDTVQRVLVGRPGQTGTGAIPKDAIAELVSARGIPDLLDSIKVNHVFGGQSVIGLKSYLSGREKFKGETLSGVWLDEEPPMDIYSEALTRTNIGQSGLDDVHAIARHVRGCAALSARPQRRAAHHLNDHRRCAALFRRRKGNDHRELPAPRIGSTNERNSDLRFRPDLSGSRTRAGNRAQGLSRP